jgi:hypothetical protein
MLASGLLVVAVSGLTAPAGPLYTVAQLRTALAANPRSWLGRTALVRALVFPLRASCPTTQSGCSALVLTDRAPGPAPAPPLIATAAPPAPLLRALRWLPRAERLLAPPA